MRDCILQPAAKLPATFHKMFKEKFGYLRLRPASTSLKTCTGTELSLCGETEVHVEYQGQSAKLPLIVAEVDGKPAILGRNWLSAVMLNCKELFNVSSPDFVGELSARCKGVFGPGLGKIKEFEAMLWPPRSFISPDLYRRLSQCSIAWRRRGL